MDSSAKAQYAYPYSSLSHYRTPVGTLSSQFLCNLATH